MSDSAAAMIGGNEDLLIRILLFLPAKSLVRLKLVSKQWQSVICNPYFCRRHTLKQPRHSESEALFILGNYDSPEYIVYSPRNRIRRFFPFRFPMGFSNAVILQSCNGLVLVIRFVGKGEERYHVFNPTTMQQRELPPPPIPTRSYVDGLYLMFDPSLSLHYRVVCFAYAYAFDSPWPDKQGTLTLYVYHSETHQWKQLEGERSRLDLKFRSGTYFNGGIYFDRSDPDSHFSDYILSRLEFHPDPDNTNTNTNTNINNVMSNIPLPLPPVGCTTIGGMTTESNGYLLCYTLYRNDHRADFGIDVWEWEMHENTWTNKCRIDLNRTFGETGLFYAVEVLGIFRGLAEGEGEEEQDSFLLFRAYDKILIYKFHHVFELHDSTSPTPLLFRDAHHFINSIAPV